MKRVALCTAILLVIILLCTASLVTVSRYQRDFTKAIQDLEQAVYQETFEVLSVRAASVCRDWMDAEHVLIRFVRHTELDEVTGAMTRLEKLEMCIRDSCYVGIHYVQSRYAQAAVLQS